MVSPLWEPVLLLPSRSQGWASSYYVGSMCSHPCLDQVEPIRVSPELGSGTKGRCKAQDCGLEKAIGQGARIKLMFRKKLTQETEKVLPRFQVLVLELALPLPTCLPSDTMRNPNVLIV